MPLHWYGNTQVNISDEDDKLIVRYHELKRLAHIVHGGGSYNDKELCGMVNSFLLMELKNAIVASSQKTVVFTNDPITEAMSKVYKS